MASKESGAVTKLYRMWLSATAEDDVIQDPRHWDILTTEPGGVDYIETDAGGVPALWAVPKGAEEDRVLLCIHGGGFIGGSMFTHRKLFAHIAKEAGIRALIVNYRLLPSGVHPAPADDALTAYRWLLGQGIGPGHIAVAGDSSGGGVSVGMQVRGRDEGLPLPAATLLLSPWVDMEVSGETALSNAGKDALFNKPWVQQMAGDFLGGTSPRDPQASPLYADLTGFGPVYIQVGDQELLLDDSRRLAGHAERAGVGVRLDIFPDQQHTFQMMAGRAPEATDAVRSLAEWVRPRLGLTGPARTALAEPARTG